MFNILYNTYFQKKSLIQKNKETTVFCLLIALNADKPIYKHQFELTHGQLSISILCSTMSISSTELCIS